MRNGQKSLRTNTSLDEKSARIFSNVFLAFVALVIFGKYELIILHPDRPQKLFGIMCDDRDAADFLERNFKKNNDRGRLMYRLHMARTIRQMEQGVIGNKSAQEPSFCLFDLWEVKTGKLNIVFRRVPATVSTTFQKSTITELGIFPVLGTGYIVVLDDFREKREVRGEKDTSR